MGWALLCGLLLATNPYLEDGRRLYGAVHYEEAEAKLKLARGVSNSTVGEQRETYDLLARSIAAQGRPEEAKRTYEDLLTRDPGAPEPKDASPRIRALFLQAKERVYPQGMVRLARAPSPLGTVALDVLDPWARVASLSFFTAPPGHAFVQSAARLQDGRATASLDDAPGGPVRWYAEAKDLDGLVLARLEGEARPRALIPVEPPAQVEAPAVSVLSERPPPRRRLAPVGLTAFGGVLVGGAGVLYGLAWSDYKSLQPVCPCPPSQWRAGRNLETASYATLGAGAAVVAAGLAWWWQGRSRTAEP